MYITSFFKDLGYITPGGTVFGLTDVRNTFTNILPELKAGGAYNFNDDLAVTLAYMYAFGNRTDLTFNSSASATGGFRQNVKASTAPASLSTLLLGLRYSFA